jgi:gluconate 2-dehydrogenase gamma chain
MTASDQPTPCEHPDCADPNCKKPNDPALRRRSLLTGLVTTLPAVALAQAPASAPITPAPTVAPTIVGPAPCQFLNPQERRALEALCNKIIPTDDLGPGAVDSGVVQFLDRQLATAWGAGDHFYKSGPFMPGTPQQGYQLAFTPADMFREGLARLDDAARKLHGRDFAGCAPSDQEAMMTAMHDDKLDLSPVPAGLFLTAVIDGTIEGFFSDPIYGGNKDMAGWKMVGFPGAYASYAQEIDRHGLEWKRPPVSMADDQDIDSMPGITDAMCVAP